MVAFVEAESLWDSIPDAVQLINGVSAIVKSASIDVLVVLVNVDDACSSVSSVRGATDRSSIV